MKIEFDDRVYEFDLETIDLKQAIAIELTYGFTLDDWYKALETASARALQCLYWLILQQNGVIKPIKECNCSIMALSEAFTKAQAAEAAEAQAAKEAAPEPEPDPTPRPSPPAGPPLSGPGSPTAMTPQPLKNGEVPVAAPTV